MTDQLRRKLELLEQVERDMAFILRLPSPRLRSLLIDAAHQLMRIDPRESPAKALRMVLDQLAMCDEEGQAQDSMDWIVSMARDGRAPRVQ